MINRGPVRTPVPDGTPTPIVPPAGTVRAVPSALPAIPGLAGLVAATPDGVLLFSYEGNAPEGAPDQFARGRWKVQTFRAGNVTRNATTGLPSFGAAAVSPAFVFRDFPTPTERWRPTNMTLYLDPDVTENPYVSDAAGAPTDGGAFRTYRLTFIGELHRMLSRNPAVNGDGDVVLGLRKGFVTIADAGKPTAAPVAGSLVGDWVPMRFNAATAPARDPQVGCTGRSALDDFTFAQFGDPSVTIPEVDCPPLRDPSFYSYVRGRNPQVTADGRLLFWDGGVDFEGRDIVFAVNQRGNLSDGWSYQRYVSSLCAAGTEVIDGLPLGRRYPLARQCFRRWETTTSAGGEETAQLVAVTPGTALGIGGRNPTVDPEGRNLLFVALRYSNHRNAPVSAGLAAVGEWTTWAVQHVDGPLEGGPLDGNLLGAQGPHFAFGPSPGLWNPFRNHPDGALPFLEGRPVLPVLSPQGRYAEMTFEDTRPWRYLVYLRMNETLAKTSVRTAGALPAGAPIDDVFFGATPDSSPYGYSATLEGGAAFPFPTNGNPGTVGIHGQAIAFPPAGRVRITRPPSFTAEHSGMLTVHLWLKRLVAADGAIPLVVKPGQFELSLTAEGALSATLQVDNALFSERTATAGLVPMNAWTHVALRYDSSELLLLVDGRQVFREARAAVAPLQVAATDLSIGPGAKGGVAVAGIAPMLLIDEVGIAGGLFSAEELWAAAFLRVPRSLEIEDRLALPLGLRGTKVPRETRETILLTKDAVELGQELFFDKRLSGDGTISCATCHKPSLNFTDGLALGFGRSALWRASPSLVNGFFGLTFPWNGAVKTLAAQSLLPIQHPLEMNSSLDGAVARLKQTIKYPRLFRAAFGSEPNIDDLSRALASFEATILNGNSAVDRFEAGELSALAEQERLGRSLFRGKARCITCHEGSNYTDERFHNVAVLAFNDDADMGRAGVTGRNEDRRAFKTPTLRGAALTAPYFHNGQATTLAFLVSSFSSGGLEPEALFSLTPPSLKDTDIFPLGLDIDEISAVTEFVEALSGETSYGAGNLVATQVEGAWKEILGQSTPANAVDVARAQVAAGGTLDAYRETLTAGAAFTTRITATWNAVLGRAPTAMELASARFFFGAGGTMTDYRAQLVASTEGATKIQDQVTAVFGAGSPKSATLVKLAAAHVVSGGSLAAALTLLTSIKNASAPVRLTVPVPVLAAPLGLCTSDDLKSNACRTAAHQLAFELGFATAAGPNEISSAAVEMTLLPAARMTTVMSTTTALRTFDPACNLPSSRLFSFACQRAAYRLCRAGGAGNGSVGVVELNGSSATVACIPAAFATIRETTLVALNALHVDCDRDLDAGACGAAISRACVAAGAVDGVAAEPGAGESWRATCLSP